MHNSNKPIWHLIISSALIVALLLLSSCVNKTKTSQRSGGKYAFIDEKSIYIDRIGDGTRARLQFKTKKPALCDFSWEPQENTKKEAPIQATCSNQTSAQTEFNEQIVDLKTDALYLIKLTLWSSGSARESGETITIKEQSSSTDMVTSDGTNTKFKELLVARLDIPLRSAEVHRTVLSEEMTSETLKQKLTLQPGCRQGTNNFNAPFRTPKNSVGITNLATRDFAAANAVPHPEFPERLRLYYPSLNDGLDKWSLLYKSGNSDVMVTARPIGKIANMEMESTTIDIFKDPNLSEAADPLTIDTSRPLKLAWTISTALPEQSYITVSIGRPDYEKSIQCTFAASAKTGSIDSQLLKNLDDGRHVVLAELVTNQIWAKDGWLISTYDWRSGRIEK